MEKSRLSSGFFYGHCKKNNHLYREAIKREKSRNLRFPAGYGAPPIVSPSLDLVLRDAVELAVVQPPNFFGEAAGNGAGERFVHFI